MSFPRIYVDFNEMLTETEVLLANSDSKLDSSGNVVNFFEGMRISAYMDDIDEEGKADNLIAEGVASRNHHGAWSTAARWILKIDERGIRHESEEIR